MQFLEAKQSLARKLNIDYATISQNGVFSDTDLGEYIQEATEIAWDFKPWDFSMAAKTITTINAPYYDCPPDVRYGSIIALTMGSTEKGYRKTDFQDYLRFFEANPGSDKEYFAEYNGFIFVNQASYSIGEVMSVFGKKNTPKLVNSTDILPFSPATDNQEYAGNRAIIQLAYSLALASEKKKDPTKAGTERASAIDILNMLWKHFKDAGANSQNIDRPMFEIDDFYRYGRANGNPGTFNIF